MDGHTRSVAGVDCHWLAEFLRGADDRVRRRLLRQNQDGAAMRCPDRHLHGPRLALWLVANVAAEPDLCDGDSHGAFRFAVLSQGGALVSQRVKKRFFEASLLTARDD